MFAQAKRDAAVSKTSKTAKTSSSKSSPAAADTPRDTGDEQAHDTAQEPADPAGEQGSYPAAVVTARRFVEATKKS